MTESVLLSMLDRTGTIRHRAQTGTVDRANNPTWVVTTSEVNCYVEQTQAEEITVGETTATSTHLGVLESGVTFDASDELVVDGVTYEAVGHPWSVWEPGTGESHIESRLRVVT